jgi:uncharacterized membrane protein
MMGTVETVKIQAESSAGNVNWRLTSPHLLVLVAFAVLCCWPLFTHGLPDLGHDSISHVTWQKSFSSQFWRGELYPRWLSDQNKGLGSPTYYFYPPFQVMQLAFSSLLRSKILRDGCKRD